MVKEKSQGSVGLRRKESCRAKEEFITEHKFQKNLLGVGGRAELEQG